MRWLLALLSWSAVLYCCGLFASMWGASHPGNPLGEIVVGFVPIAIILSIRYG